MAIIAASAVCAVIWGPRTTTLAAEPTAKPADTQRANPKSGQTASETQGADAVASQTLCTRTRPREGGRPVAGGSGQGSTLALSRWPDGSTIAYVAHADDRSLVAVDVDKKIVRGTTSLDGEPSSVLVLSDGRVVATIRDKSRIQVFEPGATPTQPLRSLCRVTVAAEPVGLAVTPDDHTLLVTSAWGHELAALDTRTFGVRLRAELPREPRAVVASDDGQRAFVAHVVDAKMSVVDLTSKTNNVRDISLSVTRDSQLMRGCQGFALAKSVDTVPKDGGETSTLRGALPPPRAAAAKPMAAARAQPSAAAPPPSSTSTSATAPSDAPPPSTLAGRVFAPMVVVDVGTEGSPGYGNVERGPTETPFVSVVDAGAERSLSRSVSRDPTIRAGECVLPRAAAFAASRGVLLVACLGSDAVVELDARGVRMSKLEHRRWQVPKGPTGIVVDAAKNRAVVWSQFDASISTLALDDAGALASIAVPARKDHAMIADVARGRLLFHAIGDKRLSKDGRACASCHPDGRDDALTWQTPDGARQTIMLAGRVDGTAPFSWSGKNATVEKHLESTLSRLGGTGLGDSDAADKRALLAYVRTLTPPPSGPAPLADRVLVARGEKLFDDDAQGCATCHAGGGTDHHAHEVDLQVVGARVGEAFDTPSLRFVGGTAPYFHDGRFATLDELLSSPDHAMGSSLHLSRDDRVALSAYLETL